LYIVKPWHGLTGGSLINTVMFALEADTVEYGEWKSGTRSEGTTYAIFSFTRKLTQSLGGAIGAWALAIGGYLEATKAVPNPVEPGSAIIAIKAWMGLVPAVCALIAMLVFSRYPLTDTLFRQIRDETEARKRALPGVVLPEGGLEARPWFCSAGHHARGRGCRDVRPVT
jgi:glucuronide carrier protein